MPPSIILNDTANDLLESFVSNFPSLIHFAVCGVVLSHFRTTAPIIRTHVSS